MTMDLRSRSRENKNLAVNTTSNTASATRNATTNRSSIKISNLSAAAQSTSSTAANETNVSAQTAPNVQPDAPLDAQLNAQPNGQLSAQLSAQLNAPLNAPLNAQLDAQQASPSVSSSASSLALFSCRNNEATTPLSTRPNARDNSQQLAISSDASEDDDNDMTYTDTFSWDEYRKRLESRQTFATLNSPNPTQSQDTTSKLGHRVSFKNSNVTLAQSLSNLQRGTNQQATTTNSNVTLAQASTSLFDFQQQPTTSNNNVTLAQASTSLFGFQQQPTISKNNVTLAQTSTNLFNVQQQPTATQAVASGNNNSVALAHTLWPDLFQQQTQSAQAQPQLNANVVNQQQPPPASAQTQPQPQLNANVLLQQQAPSAPAQTHLQQNAPTANQQQLAPPASTQAQLQLNANFINQPRAQPAQTQPQPNANALNQQRAPSVQIQAHLNGIVNQQAQPNQTRPQLSANIAAQQPIIQSQRAQQLPNANVLRPQQPIHHSQPLPQLLSAASPPIATQQQPDTSMQQQNQLLQLVLQQLQQNVQPVHQQQPFVQTPPSASLYNQAYLPIQPNQQYMSTPQQPPAQYQQDSPAMLQILNNILQSLNKNNELITSTLNNQSTPSFFFPTAHTTASANAQQQQINTVSHYPPQQPHLPMLNSTQATAPTPTTIVITNPNLPAIAPFDGLTDVFDFFDKMDSIVKNLNYDDSQAANFVPTHLTGDASKSLRICTNKQSYAAIKKHLIEDYSKTLDQYWNEFLTIRPKADERTKSFCINIQRILEIAKPKMAAEEKEALLKNKLSKFLTNDLKALFAMHDFKYPWAEMVRMSSKVMERFNSAEVVKTKNCLVSNEYNDVDENSETEANPEQTVVSRKCIVCNLGNHSTESCYKLQNAISSGFFGQGSNSARSNNNYRKQQQQSNQSKAQSKPASNSNQSASSSQKSNATPSNSDVKAKVCQIMSISKETNLHYMNVTFTLADHQTKLKTLIDSGATNSFINLNRLPVNLQSEINDFMNGGTQPNRFNLKVRHVTVETFNSVFKTTCCEALISFKISNYSGQHRFIIDSNINAEEAIIGNDFLLEHNIWLMGSELRIIGRSDLNSTSECTTKSDVTIPAQSEFIIKTSARVANLIKLNKAVLFEPYDFNNMGLTMANSIDHVGKNGQVFVKLMNFLDSSISLPRGTPIGSISPCSLPMQTIKVSNQTLNDSTNSNKLDLKEFKLNKELSDDQNKQLLALIERYSDVFSRSDYDLGKTNLIKHPINTGNAEPVKQAPYRIPQKMREITNKKIEELLNADLIEYSSSPWASPTLLVPKRDGSWRFCIDFRKLNKATHKDAYPMPRVDDSIDALGDSYYFSSLDLISGFWQIQLDAEAKEKTAFVIQNGMYQFKYMPFGLCNGPSTFQRLMDMVLRKLSWSCCIAYFDDIIVYSKTFEQHLIDLEAVLARLRQANLKVKPSKCSFACDSIVFLGFLITRVGIRPDPSKIEKIANIVPPTTVTDVKSFLGLASYYRKFIPKLSEIALPLFKLTRKNVEFVWCKLCDRAFEEIKVLLASSPVLALPDFSKPFRIHCDASGHSLGSVISQIFENGERPIAYASRALNDHERNYSTSEREMLAIVWSAKKFKQYIYGFDVEFLTDHKPLVDLVKFSEPSGRLAKLIVKIQHLNYTLTYKRGLDNANADALSRLKFCAVSLIFDLNWRELQEQDDELQMLKQQLDFQVHQPKLDKFYQNHMSKISFENGLFYFQTEANKCIIVPLAARSEVLKELHARTLSGHLGINKTKDKIRERFVWPGMNKDIKAFIMSCDICNRVKHKHFSLRAPLKPIVCSCVLDMMSIDVAGPLETTKAGNRYIIIVVDNFSKYIEAIAVPDFNAETTANFIINKVICKYGVVKSIHSDQGVNFESELVKQVCKLLRIDKIKSVSYHPQSNGQVERAIQTVKTMMSCFVAENNDDWDLCLDQVIYAYNTSVNESTKHTPFEIMFGRPAKQLIDNTEIKLDSTPITNDAVHKYLKQIKENQNQINKLVESNLIESRQRQKDYYDKKTCVKTKFNIGDLVLYKNFRKTGLEPNFIGPLKLIQINRDDTFVIGNLNDDITRTVHYDQLAKYMGEAKQPRNGGILRKRGRPRKQKPNKSTKPSNPIEPSNSIEPIKPIKPSKPIKPIKPSKTRTNETRRSRTPENPQVTTTTSGRRIARPNKLKY